ATFTKAHLDYDDGIAVYEIEFIAGTMEYDVEVDARTGAVREFDAESIYDD
ncbi:MAG: PepSY domain-containing protein, partial [Lachnospiraceae bacterium]|nr:PepSY domain-containing protein [Lachnospiraceae bacterium]